MKIIYNSSWLHNLMVQKKAKRWARQELISDDEKEKILAAYPVGFYMPSIWLAIGLFVFTVVLLLAAGGFIFFVIVSGPGTEKEVVFQVLLFFFSIVCFFIAEHYKKDKHYFHAGTDNALIWMSLVLFIAGLSWTLQKSVISDQQAMVLVYLIAAGICFAATIRYADPFVALGTFVNWLLFLFFFLGNLGAFAKAILPFASFLNAAFIYYFVKKNAKSEKLIFYASCLKIVEIASLVAVYLSVNYFVVREMSAEMFHHYYVDGEEIPFAYVFYFFTVAIPPVYIYFGLIRKDRVLLRIGLLLIVASILTIRHYHSVLPVEKALTMGGAFLIGASYILIRWLKIPKYGFSYGEEEDSKIGIAESLLVVQSFGKTNAPSQEGFSMGHGDFGGAGSSDTY